MIELGDRVRDKLSGGIGIVVAITDWLYGCRRVNIQPEELKEGKLVDTFVVDDPQLEILEKGIIVNSRKGERKEVSFHGPRKDPTRAMISNEGKKDGY